jgi:hypothetical protein
MFRWPLAAGRDANRAVVSFDSMDAMGQATVLVGAMGWFEIMPEALGFSRSAPAFLNNRGYPFFSIRGSI